MFVENFQNNHLQNIVNKCCLKVLCIPFITNFMMNVAMFVENFQNKHLQNIVNKCCLKVLFIPFISNFMLNV